MTAAPAPQPAPAPDTAMCECSHHWGAHAASGQTANTAACHGYTGSATPGPLRESCRCTGFRPWAGPWDSRTGEPVKPLMVTTPAAPAPEEVPVRLVRLWLCDPCLDGAGGECHTPGCAMWINRAPDIPLRDSPMVTILADPAPEAWDASVPPGGYVCSACGIPVESEPCPDHDVPAPEAATPPMSLAAELEAEAARLTAISSPHGKIGETRAHFDVQARAEGLHDAARTVRERLAPAWDALAAERDGLAGDCAQYAAQLGTAYADRDALAARLAEAEAERDEQAKLYDNALHSALRARDENERLQNALTLAMIAAREMSDEFATWTVTPEDQARITAWRQQAGLEAP